MYICKIYVVINTAVDWLGVYGFRMTKGFFSLDSNCIVFSSIKILAHQCNRLFSSGCEGGN